MEPERSEVGFFETLTSYLHQVPTDGDIILNILAVASRQGRRDVYNEVKLALGRNATAKISAVFDRNRRQLLVDVERRGLSIAPEIAVGDGALGFWMALDEIFPGTRHQRCWVYKTANVLNKVAKSVQGTMKADLREIHAAPTRAAAEAALVVFVEKYGAKYARAADCLTKDRKAMLAFFDMPAEHWDHLRTTNPIENT